MDAAPDVIAFMAAHLALIGLLLVAIWKGIVEPRLSPGLPSKITRGDNSMASIFAFYGAAIFLYTQVITLTDDLEGYRTAVAIVDYVVLTYLFLFNMWVRNRVVGWGGRLREEHG